MTNEQLVMQIQKGENETEDMAQLYEQMRRFIHAMAWKYRDSGEVEDLEQEGFLALYDAVKGYDPEQGAQFLTYAKYWIRQRMQRYLQNSGSSLRFSVCCQEKVQQYKRLCNAFNREYNREPSDREAAALLGLSMEQIENTRKSAGMIRLGSLDAPVKGLEAEGVTVADAVADPADLESDVLDRIQREQLYSVLWECVDSLEGRQPGVIRKRYQEGRSLTAIGADYGVTGEVIRQTERTALRALRGGRNRKKLLPFIDIYGMALVGNGTERFSQTWTSSTERAALKIMEWEERHLGASEHCDITTGQGKVWN